MNFFLTEHYDPSDYLWRKLVDVHGCFPEKRIENGQVYWIVKVKDATIDGFDVRFFNEDHEMHREVGPACTLWNGRNFWVWHGRIVNCKTQEEFERLKKLMVFQ